MSSRHLVVKSLKRLNDEDVNHNAVHSAEAADQRNQPNSVPQLPNEFADEKDPFKELYEALGTAYMQMDITMDLKSKYEQQGLYVALGKIRDALVKLHVLACAVKLKDDDGIELKIATVIVDYIEEYEAFMDFMEGRRDTVTVAKK